MDAVILRAAVPEDAAAIARINREAFDYADNMEDTARRLQSILKKPVYRLWVAELAGRVVGYIQAGDYDNTYQDPQKNILALGLLREARGRGIGRMLLERAEAWAREECCMGVRLVSGMNRAEAHEFYLHCGYRDRKDQKNFVKTFADMDCYKEC